jgi:hypothetical protein
LAIVTPAIALTMVIVGFAADGSNEIASLRR